MCVRECACVCVCLCFCDCCCRCCCCCCCCCCVLLLSSLYVVLCLVLFLCVRCSPGRVFVVLVFLFLVFTCCCCFALPADIAFQRVAFHFTNVCFLVFKNDVTAGCGCTNCRGSLHVRSASSFVDFTSTTVFVHGQHLLRLRWLSALFDCSRLQLAQA